MRSSQFAPYDDGDRTHKGLVLDKALRVYFENVSPCQIDRHGSNAMREEFEKFGPIEAFSLFTDRFGRFSGQGICTYRNTADARRAIEGMNRQVYDGYELQVTVAKEHGVILLEQLQRKTAVDSTEDRWTHDKFEESQRRSEQGRGRGGHRGRGGRGRGRGLPQSIQHVESQFEKYTAERDATAQAMLNAELQAQARLADIHDSASA